MQIQDAADLKKDIQKLLKGQQAMQTLINSLVEENKKKDEVINKLSGRVDELEQYTRRDDVIISGLNLKPKSYSDVTKSNEDESNADSTPKVMQSTESQVLSFLNENGVKLEESEVSACHPLYTKDKSKPPLIVVRFVSRKSKDKSFA